MPYTTVTDARKRVKALKNFSTEQVKTFIKVFNKLERQKNIDEQSCYAQAIAAAKKVKKELYMGNIKKATANDVKDYLRQAIKEKFADKSVYIYCIDYDDEYAYFIKEIYKNDEYFTKTYRVKYTIDGVNVALDDNLEEVMMESTYTPVKNEEDFVGKSLVKNLRGLFEEFFSKDKPDSVFKQNDKGYYIEKFQEEEMIAYEPLYVPPDTPDGEGEGMTEAEIEKMVKDIKSKIEKGTMQANLFHKIPTKSFEWVDVFTNPWPTCTVGDQEVVKGQPVAVCKYHNKKAWELRKQGIIKGPSIEGKVGNKRVVEEN
jgi:hypothetical protein